MLNAMDRFRELPDDTKIFCGHEYTIKNFEFAMMVEPDNEDIKKHFISFSEKISTGFYSVPGLLSEEKLYNVFMHCREKSV